MPPPVDILSCVPEKLFYSIQVVIVKIDELNNSITFDVLIYFSWAPATWTFDVNTSSQFARVAESSLDWVPEVNFYSVKEKTATEMSYFVDPSSGCTSSIMNWVIDCYETLELQQFPFDRQLAKMTLFLTDVRLTPMRSLANGGVPCPKSFPPPAKQTECIVDLGNWDLNGMKSSLELLSTDTRLVDSELRCKIEITRIPTFYLWNIVLVIFVLVLSSFCAIGVPTDDLADRMSITLTLALTIVAFKFVIAGMVPPTPYLTFLDKYFLFSFVVIGTEVVENFILSYATSNSSLHFEYVFYFILFVLWILLHLILVIGTHFQWFFQSWETVRELDNGSRQTVENGYEAVAIKTDDGIDSGVRNDIISEASNDMSFQKRLSIETGVAV